MEIKGPIGFKMQNKTDWLEILGQQVDVDA